ncbi:hypothetical protein OC846_003847 [Tilletia horrida]|uniref:Uncharacterized protein n=1 Tax=Tilletia horrida TaxID=155126 RepID=A0AAN6JXK3_9BASI|nr:hypothetical protein OC846_003847 [Tilletia horrida]
MDSSKPIGDDLFAPPTHSTTPAGLGSYSHDEEDDGSGPLRQGSAYTHEDGAEANFTPSGRPAPGSKLSSQSSNAQLHQLAAMDSGASTPSQLPPSIPIQPPHAPLLRRSNSSALKMTTGTATPPNRAPLSTEKALPLTPPEALLAGTGSGPASSGHFNSSLIPSQARTPSGSPASPPPPRLGQDPLKLAAAHVAGSIKLRAPGGAPFTPSAVLSASPTNIHAQEPDPFDTSVGRGPVPPSQAYAMPPSHHGQTPSKPMGTSALETFLIPPSQSSTLQYPIQAWPPLGSTGEAAAAAYVQDHPASAHAMQVPLAPLHAGQMAPPPFPPHLLPTAGPQQGSATLPPNFVLNDPRQDPSAVASPPPVNPPLALPPLVLPKGAPIPLSDQGGRFPRWRAWLQHRDMERRNAAMAERAQAAAEGRPVRKKSWGAGVRDPDAIPYDLNLGSSEIEDVDEEEDEYGYDYDQDGPDEEGFSHGGHSSRRASSASFEPQIKRRRTGPPPPLHTHHFGSRFLPHLPSQPLCAVFLDIPPKPTTAIVAVAAAPSATAPPNRRPGGRPSSIRRTVILVGTADGLYAVELARPKKKSAKATRAENHDGASFNGRRSYSNGDMDSAQFYQSSSGASFDTDRRSRVRDEYDEAQGWNGGIRVVQVWSGLGVYQLSILQSRPPPSAMFGPDGATLPPPTRKPSNTLFGGFTPIHPSGGASAQGTSATGAILLALTAPAPAPHGAVPPLTRISPQSNTAFESSALASGAEKHSIHHHHHSRAHSHAAHDSGLSPDGLNSAGPKLSAGMNLEAGVAPGSFGTDSGGGPGRAIPTTLSSTLAAHVANISTTAHNLSAADAGAAAAAAATIANLAAGVTGTPNGQVRMWNLEAIRGCVAFALDSDFHQPLDLLSQASGGGKKGHKHARNKLSRAFKKVFGGLGDGQGTGNKMAVRPGLSDSVSMDTVETLASSGTAKLTKNRDQDRDSERRWKLGQRTASDGNLGGNESWTVIDDLNATSPTSLNARSELDSDTGHGSLYAESARSVGQSLDEDRRTQGLSPELDETAAMQDPTRVAQEASRKAAHRLALSSIVIPSGTGSGHAQGTLPGPSIPAYDESKKSHDRSGGERSNSNSGTQTPGGTTTSSSATSGIGPVTGNTGSGSAKPVLFYAVHEAPPSAKGAGTWYLALATSKTITVYEARPPKSGATSFLPLSGHRGGPNAGAQSWSTHAQGVGGAAGETRSWSVLRELYIPATPKAIAFAQANTTEVPLTAKEKGGPLPPASILTPQFSGGLAGPRGWMGADLSLLVTFGHKAVIIRMTDLNVRDVDLMPTSAPLPDPRAFRASTDAVARDALGEDISNLSLDPSGRSPHSLAHHRRASSSSQLLLDEKQNWVGLQLVDVNILLKQTPEASDALPNGGFKGGHPMTTSLSAEAAMTSSRSSRPGLAETTGRGPPDMAPTPVFTSVLSPNAALEQRAFAQETGQLRPDAAGGPIIRPNISTSGSESAATVEDDEDDDFEDDDDDITQDASNQYEIVYTATGRKAVALRDRSVHLSTGSGSRSDPTLAIVDRTPVDTRELAAAKKQPAGRRRDREKKVDPQTPGKLVSTSIALVTRGAATQILPLPLPANLNQPKPLDVFAWGGIPNSVTGWARVVGLERERTTGALTVSDMGNKASTRGLSRHISADAVPTDSMGRIILHVNVTALAFMASKVESQRKRVRVHVSLNFPLLRNAEIELLPVLDSLLPAPATSMPQPPGPHQGNKAKPDDRAYALGVARANEICICADPPRIDSDSATFDAARRPSLAEAFARTEQEFEYLSGMLVGFPHRGGVRPASVAALDVTRPWEMRGDGGVLGWDWRGGRDFRLFFVGAEV